MKRERATSLRRVILIATALLLLAACGNAGYSPREFPTEGKKAFEDYLDKYATKYEDLEGNPKSDIGYMIQWAPKGRDLRTNITGAWCIITGDMVWMGNTPSLFFVVYQTEDEKWLVSPSDSDYKKVGCPA